MSINTFLWLCSFQSSRRKNVIDRRVAIFDDGAGGGGGGDGGSYDGDCNDDATTTTITYSAGMAEAETRDYICDDHDDMARDFETWSFFVVLFFFQFCFKVSLLVADAASELQHQVVNKYPCGEESMEICCLPAA